MIKRVIVYSLVIVGTKICCIQNQYKRPFHRSDKWKEYVERRKANGWHSRYYGDAVAV
jgi:hypothetical protein